MMNYLCAKFGDFIFSRFGFIVRTDRQNHRQPERLNRTQRREDRYSHVGVSNNIYLMFVCCVFGAKRIRPGSMSNYKLDYESPDSCFADFHVQVCC